MTSGSFPNSGSQTRRVWGLPQEMVVSPQFVVEMNHMTAFVYHSLSRIWFVLATFGGSSAKTMIQFCGGWTKVRYLLVSNDSLSVFMDGPGRGCCVACCVSRPALVALRISIRTDSSAAHWISTSYPQGFPLARNGLSWLRPPRPGDYPPSRATFQRVPRPAPSYPHHGRSTR